MIHFATLSLNEKEKANFFFSCVQIEWNYKLSKHP